LNQAFLEEEWVVEAVQAQEEEIEVVKAEREGRRMEVESFACEDPCLISLIEK
jgi:hypothetical protein